MKTIITIFYVIPMLVCLFDTYMTSKIDGHVNNQDKNKDMALFIAVSIAPILNLITMCAVLLTGTIKTIKKEGNKAFECGECQMIFRAYQVKKGFYEQLYPKNEDEKEYYECPYCESKKTKNTEEYDHSEIPYAPKINNMQIISMVKKLEKSPEYEQQKQSMKEKEERMKKKQHETMIKLKLKKLEEKL